MMPSWGLDVEWVIGKCDQPNIPSQLWAPNQAAPAAFIKRSPIQPTATFTVRPAAITQIAIAAANTGMYGGIQWTTLTVTGGFATRGFAASALVCAVLKVLVFSCSACLSVPFRSATNNKPARHGDRGRYE
jgi:hypothetical protein